MRMLRKAGWLLALVGILLGLLRSGAGQGLVMYKEIQFQAGTLMATADYYGTDKRDVPVVLLFHQAGSSRGEYRGIAPQVQGMGFHCLAVDQRAGDKDPWAKLDNKTAALAKEKQLPTGYLDAYLDLEGALRWADREGYKSIVVWGSSYSAALVFKLAAEHGDKLAAVLSYSPGEYIKDESVAGWAGKLKDIPCFIACGASANEQESARQIYEAATSKQRTFYVAKKGRHGSSILMDDAANWDSVQKFLTAFKAPPAQK